MDYSKITSWPSVIAIIVAVGVVSAYPLLQNPNSQIAGLIVIALLVLLAIFIIKQPLLNRGKDLQEIIDKSIGEGESNLRLLEEFKSDLMDRQTSAPQQDKLGFQFAIDQIDARSKMLKQNIETIRNNINKQKTQ
jgi:hypothetical protein